MTPHILIFDNASDTPTGLRDLVLDLEFGEVVNPVDQVTYPFIARATPLVMGAMRALLARSLHGVPHINFCFARAMPRGVAFPHEIHNDISMGQYSAHLYLNPEAFPGTGTQFWSHEVFGRQADPTQAEMFAHLMDQSLGAWSKDLMVTAKFNRLLIHDSRLWHSACPNSGWGKDQTDGRLVLTTFFDMES